MTGRWLTYEDAAQLLGMTPDSLRHRARREFWEKQINDQGKAIVLVPASVIPGPDSTPPTPLPPRIKPVGPELVVEHLARMAEIGSRMGELLVALDGAQLSEQDRIERIAGDTADLARQFASAMTDAIGRGDVERSRADAAENHVRGLENSLREAEECVRRVDEFTQSARWKLLFARRPPQLLGFAQPLDWIRKRYRGAA